MNPIDNTTQENSIKEIPVEEKRRLTAWMIFSLWILVILIAGNAGYNVLSNYEYLLRGGNTIDYYLTLVNEITDFLIILLSITLLLPGRRKNAERRNKRRLSYFSTLLVGFVVTLLINNGKKLLPYIEAKNFSGLYEQIPLLVISTILLLIVFGTRRKVNYKTSNLKTIFINLYIFSFVILISSAYHFYMYGLDMDSGVQLGLAIFSFIYTLSYRKLAVNIIEKKSYTVGLLNGKKIRIYSKNDDVHSKTKAMAVLSILFNLTFLAFGCYNANKLMASFDNQKMNQYLFFYIFLWGCAALNVLLLLFLGKALRKKNGAKLTIASLYVACEMIFSIIFSLYVQSPTTGAIIHIKGFEGTIAFSTYIILLIFPLACYKHVRGTEEIRPFEESCRPLLIADFLLFMYILFCMGFTGHYDFFYCFALASILFHFFFILSVRKRGYLEYEKAGDNEEVEIHI